MNRSAISTTVVVILTAIIVGSVVGGATSYIFSTRSDSTIQEVRADLRAVADAAGVPISNPAEMKKLLEERKIIEAAKQEGKVVVYTQAPLINAPVRSAFERKYPFITVEFVTGTATELDARLISEYEKGVKGADVSLQGDVNLIISY